MHANPSLLSAIAGAQVKHALEHGDDERRAAEAQAREEPAERVGRSHRLRDGSWLYLRHESS